MATLQHLEALLDDITNFLPEVTDLEGDPQTGWRLRFDGGGDMKISWLEDSRKLFLAVAIGTLQEENRLETYETLLAYNSLYEQTGGLMMSVDRHTQRVIQTFELPLEGLEAGKLVAVIEELLSRAEIWQAIVKGIDHQDDDTPSESVEHAMRI